MTGVDISGTITPTTPTVNPDTLNGKLVVAWASASSLSNSGALIKIKVKFRGAGTTNLTTIGSSGQTFIFNSGTPSINTTIGKATTTSSIQQFTVLTSSNPSNGGTTSGSGTFNSGSSVVVTATPNTGYIFTNWTENGSIASTSSSYSFTLGSNRILVANFTANSNSGANYIFFTKGAVGSNDTDIYQIMTDGTNLQLLYNDNRRCQNVQLSSDRSKFIFTSNASSTGKNEIFILNSGNNTAQQLTSYNDTYGTHDPRFFGTSKIWFDRSPVDGVQEWWEMNYDGSGKVQKSNWQAQSKQSGSFCFNSSFTKVVYEKGSPSSASSHDIFIANINLTGEQQLTSNSEWDAKPEFSPDGSKIAWIQGVDATGVSNVWIMNIDGTGKQNLTNYTSSSQVNAPVFSPDGTKIYYSYYNGSQWDIYCMNLDGSSKTNITNTQNDDEFVWYISGSSSSNTSYTVSTSSSPNAGGVTSGGGTFNSGSSVTVTATANNGYTFVNWTENSQEVSKNTSYSFTISANRNLVANFQLQNSSNPTIKPIAASSSVTKRSEFWVEVKAGDPNAVTNLFGISFKLTSSNSNCSYVDGSAENGGFLGTGSSVLFFPQKVNDQTVDIGISKLSGTGVNGSGIIAKAKFTTSSSIASGQTITFTLSDVSASNTTGQTITFSTSALSVTVSSTVDVYPGDCNNDKTVNSSDIIRIGLYYGQTRPGSNNPGGVWQAYAREPWSADGTTPMRIYADANGDGAINSADIIPVGLNYAKVYSRMIENNYAQETSLSKTTAGATLKPMLPTSVKRNTPFQVQVKIGDPTAIQNLFGISFKLQSNKSSCTYVDGSATNGGFLGTGSSVLFFPQRVNDQTVDIGLSKISGSGINGAGIIAAAQFNSSSDQIVTFSLADVTAMDQNGNSIQLDVQQSNISVDISSSNTIPVEYSLYQNYPNPFNPATIIQYQLPEQVFVSIKIFDIVGNEVASLVNEEKDAGRYEVKFDVKTLHGASLSSGVYFYQIRAGDFVDTKKLLLMK